MKTMILCFLILLTSLTFAQNNALNFDGTDDNVSIGSVFGLNGYSETVEAWVNLSSTSEQGFFVHVGNTDTGYGIGVGTGNVYTTGNELIVLIDQKRWITTAANIGTGWHHVAMTMDGTGNVIVYLDGVAVKTETGNTMVPIAPSGSSSIGSAQGTIRVLSSGIIDEVRIWNDVRTLTEINANMSIELPSPSSEVNLVAYYKLNETTGTTASDSKGSNNGTLNNMVNSDWVSAQNNALNFAGTDDNVSIGSVFGLNGYSETVEAWVNLSSTSENGFFVHVGDNNTGYGIGVGNGIDVDTPGNELMVLIDQKRWISTAANIGTGWHHVAMTMDGTGNVIVYLDGVAVKTETGNTAIPIAPSGSSSIGSAQGITRILSSGIIDEVRIWNDVRTSTEINDNKSIEISNLSANLVAYYKLNETTGTTAYDSKGSNNGTLNNMVNADWVTSTAFDVVVTNTYYMAKTTGNWSSFSTVWFTNTTGGTVAANYTTQATASPTATNSAGIIIDANVTVDANVTIDQCTINTGSTLTVGTGIILTISNGVGTDLTITGAVVNGGTITIDASTSVNYNGGSQSVLALNYAALSFTGSTSGSTKTFADGTTKIGSEIALADAITLTGSSVNAVTVQVTTPSVGGTNSRVFNVDASGKTVNISNITIKGGDIAGAPSAATYGGGIYINAGTLNLNSAKVDGSNAASGGGVYNNSGTVNITNCTISNNTVPFGSTGGGIFNNSTMNITNSTISNNSGYTGGGIFTNNSTLTITNSTISNNSANSGGGIYNRSTSTLTITNSTIFNNSAVYNGAGLYINGTATVTNTTISKNNVSSSSGGAYGGGVYLYELATANIKNTIIEGNTSTGLTNDDYYYFSNRFTFAGGTLIDNGYNVVGYQAGDQTGSGKTFTATTNILYNTKADGTTGYTSWNSNNADLANQNLNLSTTLANNNTLNGTQTLALSSGSFVIDAGTDTGAPTTDQRGAARNGTTDIGSYEFNGAGGALPVELTSFTARIVDKTVVLNWKTATEVNNYGFEIQRTSNLRGQGTQNGNSDLEGYQSIGFVQGHGNSNSPKNYSFTDTTPPLSASGKVQYRLKQIDVDGKFEYSDILTVRLDLPDKTQLLQNSPNPFNPSTTIKFSIPNDADVTVKVYNLNGMEVTTLMAGKVSAGLHRVVWNGRNSRGMPAASGIYFYMLSVANGKFIQTKKMLLLK